MSSALGLYIHIPFCAARCSYCDFVSTTGKEDSMRAYVSALISEIRACGREFKGCTADTLYIGGGTPSVLYSGAVGDIISAVKDNFDCKFVEVTAECNPESFSGEKCCEYRAAGITRVSVGVQSLDGRVLSALGRLHSADTAMQAVKRAVDNGFDVSCDIMLGTPFQTKEGAAEDAEMLSRLGAEHISAYMLTLEEGTKLKRDYDSGKYVYDDDYAADTYELVGSALASLGYERYEVSNWAKEGRQCRHNLKYWMRQPYLGLGAAAHSMVGNYRFYNTCDVQKYVLCGGAGCRAIEAELTPLQEDEERLMLGLRTARGCDLSAFNDKEYAGAVRQAALNNAEYFDIRGDVICAKGKYMSVLSQLTLLLMSDKK